MARRKHKGRKSTHHRRRRVGAASNDLLMTIVGGIVGAAGAKMGATALSGALASLNPTLKKWGIVAVEVAGGYYLAKKGKPGLMKGLGLGIAITGGMQTAANLGLPGIGRLPVMIPSRGMAGMVGGFGENMPRLGAISPNRTPNGGFPRPSTVGKVDNMTEVYNKMAASGII